MKKILLLTVAMLSATTAYSACTPKLQCECGFPVLKDGNLECRSYCEEGKDCMDNGLCCVSDKICGSFCCRDDEECDDSGLTSFCKQVCPPGKECGTSDCCLNGEQCQEYYNGRDDIYDSMCCDGYAYYDYNADEPACCPSDRFSWYTETCCAEDEKPLEWEGCCKESRVYEYEDEWGGTYTACCSQDLCGTSCCGNGETCTNGECCPSNRKLNSTTCCPVGTQVVNGSCLPMCTKGQNTPNKTGTSCHSCSDLLSGCRSVPVSEYPNIGEDCPNLFIGREDGGWYGDELFAFGCNWNCESDRRPKATISECKKCGDNRYWDGCSGRDEYAGCIRKEYDGSQFTFDGAQISGCAKDNYTLNSCKNWCAQCPYPGHHLSVSDYPNADDDCPNLYSGRYEINGNYYGPIWARCDDNESRSDMVNSNIYPWVTAALRTSISECQKCNDVRYMRGNEECAFVTDDLHGTVKGAKIVSCDEGYVFGTAFTYPSCQKCPTGTSERAGQGSNWEWQKCPNIFTSCTPGGQCSLYSCDYTGDIYGDSNDKCTNCPNRSDCS